MRSNTQMDTQKTKEQLESVGTGPTHEPQTFVEASANLIGNPLLQSDAEITVKQLIKAKLEALASERSHHNVCLDSLYVAKLAQTKLPHAYRTIVGPDDLLEQRRRLLWLSFLKRCAIAQAFVVFSIKNPSTSHHRWLLRRWHTDLRQNDEKYFGILIAHLHNAPGRICTLTSLCTAVSQEDRSECVTIFADTTVYLADFIPWVSRHSEIVVRGSVIFLNCASRPESPLPSATTNPIQPQVAPTRSLISACTPRHGSQLAQIGSMASFSDLASQADDEVKQPPSEPVRARSMEMLVRQNRFLSVAALEADAIAPVRPSTTNPTTTAIIESPVAFATPHRQRLGQRRRSIGSGRGSGRGYPPTPGSRATVNSSAPTIGPDEDLLALTAPEADGACRQLVFQPICSVGVGGGAPLTTGGEEEEEEEATATVTVIVPTVVRFNAPPHQPLIPSQPSAAAGVPAVAHPPLAASDDFSQQAPEVSAVGAAALPTHENSETDAEALASLTHINTLNQEQAKCLAARLLTWLHAVAARLGQLRSQNWRQDLPF